MDIWNPIIGDEYYSVGPLQDLSGIERWQFTGDVYDIVRKETGNFFKNIEDAIKLKEYIQSFKHELNKEVK
jgi:ABC-type Na+ transport system ATPase subunit NatA